MAQLSSERKKKKKLQTKLQFFFLMWNTRKMTNILDGSVFNGAYTKSSFFICNFFFLESRLRDSRKRNNHLIASLWKSPQMAIMNSPGLQGKWSYLGKKEIATWGFSPLGKIIPGSLIEWKLPNKLFMDFTISELYKRDSISWIACQGINLHDISTWSKHKEVCS